jgi:predicted aspartyl protease
MWTNPQPIYVDLSGHNPPINFRNPTMGRVIDQVELCNHRDRMLADLGQLAREKIRRVILDGVVDTGATQLVIPGHIAAELGVDVVGAAVRYADDRRENRSIVEDVELRIQNRKGTFNAIVEPNREDALIGAVVLEVLDFIVDCGGQKLVPRDPHRIVAEIE